MPCQTSQRALIICTELLSKHFVQALEEDLESPCTVRLTASAHASPLVLLARTHGDLPILSRGKCTVIILRGRASDSTTSNKKHMETCIALVHMEEAPAHLHDFAGDLFVDGTFIRSGQRIQLLGQTCWSELDPVIPLSWCFIGLSGCVCCQIPHTQTHICCSTSKPGQQIHLAQSVFTDKYERCFCIVFAYGSRCAHMFPKSVHIEGSMRSNGWCCGTNNLAISLVLLI